MSVWIIGGLLVSLLFVVVFGKVFVPWLVEHGFVQPMKKEVVENIYSEEETEGILNAGAK